MNIDLRPARVSSLRPAVFCLAASWPWLLSLPPSMQLAASAAAVIVAWRTVGTDNSRVRQLRIEAHGGLTAVVGDSGRRFKVHSLRVPRLLSFYAELVLQLDDGQPGGGRKLRLFIVPGVCAADAFRCLRNYLLQKTKEGNFIRCATR